MRVNVPCIVVLMMFLSTGGAAQDAGYTVTDSLGRTVRFDTVPERIVLAGRGTALTAGALFMFPEAAGRVIAVADTDQGLGDFYPLMDRSFESKIRFANGAGMETIASFGPDLVILKESMRNPLGDTLETVGIPVLYLNLESANRFLGDIAAVGTLLGNQRRSSEIVDYYTKRLRTVTELVSGVARPRALVLSYSEVDGASVFAIPPASWIQTWMTETAGGIALWKEANPGGGWRKIGLEQIAVWNPDRVFIVSYRTAAAAVVGEMDVSSWWSGRLRPFPADFYSWDQPDPRWILGLQWLAATLHPDRFGGFDLRAEVKSFYATIYRLDPSTVEREILPRIFP